MNVDVYIFLRFIVIFSELFQLSMQRFARIARDRSELLRLIRLSARRVGGRDRNCEPYYRYHGQDRSGLEEKYCPDEYMSMFLVHGVDHCERCVSFIDMVPCAHLGQEFSLKTVMSCMAKISPVYNGCVLLLFATTNLNGHVGSAKELKATISKGLYYQLGT